MMGRTLATSGATALAEAHTKAMAKKGTVAFITTPNFRESSPEAFEEFVYAHMYELCDPFAVLMTGRTGRCVLDLVNRDLTDGERDKVRASMCLRELTDYDLDRWRNTIRQSMTVTMDRFQGMIHVTYELVEGRLDGVIHLTDWEDKSAKPDSAVLAREANVYNVPIAADPCTALAYIRGWKRRLAGDPSSGPVFVTRPEIKPGPLDGLTENDRVLAIIAHDNLKLETFLFALEHARHIFQNYDYILATGTTGSLLKRFMHAAGRDHTT